MIFPSEKSKTEAFPLIRTHPIRISTPEALKCPKSQFPMIIFFENRKSLPPSRYSIHVFRSAAPSRTAFSIYCSRPPTEYRLPLGRPPSADCRSGAAECRLPVGRPPSASCPPGARRLAPAECQLPAERRPSADAVHPNKCTVSERNHQYSYTQHSKPYDSIW